MKISFDEYNLLNDRLSDININYIQLLRKNKDFNFSEKEESIYHYGEIIGYLTLLDDLNLTVHPRIQGDFQIDPKCVEIMD